MPEQRWKWPGHVHGLLISRLLGVLFDGLSTLKRVQWILRKLRDANVQSWLGHLNLKQLQFTVDLGLHL